MLVDIKAAKGLSAFRARLVSIFAADDALRHATSAATILKVRFFMAQRLVTFGAGRGSGLAAAAKEFHPATIAVLRTDGLVALVAPSSSYPFADMATRWIGAIHASRRLSCFSNPADLPTIAAYLDDLPEQRRAELWPWFSSLSAGDRRDARVLDLSPDGDPGGFVGDEWEPVAEYPEEAIWVVRRT